MYIKVCVNEGFYWIHIIILNKVEIIKDNK